MKDRLSLSLVILLAVMVLSAAVQAQILKNSPKDISNRDSLNDEIEIAGFASDYQKYSTLQTLLVRNVNSKDTLRLITVIEEMDRILSRLEINAPAISKKLKSKNKETIFDLDEFLCRMSNQPWRCMKESKETWEKFGSIEGLSEFVRVNAAAEKKVLNELKIKLRRKKESGNGGSGETKLTVRNWLCAASILVVVVGAATLQPEVVSAGAAGVGTFCGAN